MVSGLEAEAGKFLSEILSASKMASPDSIWKSAFAN